jgi:hypothetical protein
MTNVIYQYTDEDAVNDGVLVPIANLNLSLASDLIDRVTNSVWRAITNSITPAEDGSLPKAEIEINLGKILQSGGRPVHAGLYQFELSPYGCIWAQKNERNRWTLMYPSDY